MGLVQKDLDETADKLKLLEFQRSMCLLNQYTTSYDSSETYEKLHTDVIHSEIKTVITKDIVNLFKAQDRHDCGSGCGTQFMIKHYKLLLADVEFIHDEIVGRSAKTGGKNKEYFDVNHEIGESGYMSYRVYFELDMSEKAKEVKSKGQCTPTEMLIGTCKVATNSGDIKLNIGMFIHFSDHKFSYRGNDATTIKRMKEDVIKNYYRYNMIKSAVDKTRLGLRRPKFIDSDEFEAFEKKVNYNSGNCKRTGSDLNECVAPVCVEVLDTLDKCMLEKTPKHFIIILDGSGSVNNYDFKNSLKTIESMIWFALNGRNKVTVFEFASGVKDLCKGITSTAQVKGCLFGRQSGGGTNTVGAFKHALKFMTDSKNFEYVTSIFTDGVSNGGLSSDLKTATSQIRQRSRLLPFGIGTGVSNTELMHFANGRGEDVMQVPDYEAFTKRRYTFQSKMCAV